MSDKDFLAKPDGFDQLAINRSRRRLIERRVNWSEEPDEILARQLAVARDMGALLHALTTISLDLLSRDWDEAGVDLVRSEGEEMPLGQWAAEQRRHLVQHMRQPHNPLLPEEQIRLGAKLDRFILSIVDLAESLIEFGKTPERLRARREMRREAEWRRENRLYGRQVERDRREAEATARGLPPPEKRPKREPAPRCAKCGKRPAKAGDYCEPCAAWIARS